ncbi:hypothetical protein AC249_AIPGENE28126 [Exaiptasia diaphana]|nr:hypothetical protein AC249_AIPGENE28126 [Exaiptasia diaphana]
MRNDRKTRPGGGVCVYIKESIPCKRLVEMEQPDVESIWIQLRPHSLPQNTSIVLLCIVYHSTANGASENVILRDHIQKNIDDFLIKHPNAMIILTGEFNPTSTGFSHDSISRANHLKQLVKFFTRDSGVLDWLLTNRPNHFELQRLPKVGTSDHYTILAKPSIQRPPRDHPTQKIKSRKQSTPSSLGNR